MIATVIRGSARNPFLIGLTAFFLMLAGLYAVARVPLDAIPDLSDVQVIVYTEYPGQAPQVVEDSCHLSTHDGDAQRAEITSGPRLLILRRLLRLRYF